MVEGVAEAVPEAPKEDDVPERGDEAPPAVPGGAPAEVSGEKAGEGEKAAGEGEEEEDEASAITFEELAELKEMVDSDVPPLITLQRILMLREKYPADGFLMGAQVLTWEKLVGEIHAMGRDKKNPAPLSLMLQYVQGAVAMSPSVPPVELVALAEGLEKRTLSSTANQAFREIDTVVDDTNLPFAKYVPSRSFPPFPR